MTRQRCLDSQLRPPIRLPGSGGDLGQQGRLPHSAGSDQHDWGGHPPVERDDGQRFIRGGEDIVPAGQDRGDLTEPGAVGARLIGGSHASRLTVTDTTDSDGHDRQRRTRRTATDTGSLGLNREKANEPLRTTPAL